MSVVTSKSLSLCWSLFVVRCKVDGRDDVDRASEVYPSEACQWKDGGNTIYMERGVGLFLVGEI